MILSHQQETAIAKVSRWFASTDRPPFFYLAGFAGTGKTTLAKYFAEELGFVVFASYTGKAASVMRDNGCDDASTIHSRIYKKPENDKQLILALKEELKNETDPVRQDAIRAEIITERKPQFSTLNPESIIRGADLVIIDECSMVDQKVALDLMSFKVPVLVLGDPAQLPPVKGAGYFTGGTPDFMLTEVHRQAQESGILRLATDIRQGKPIDCSGMDDVHIVSWGDLDIAEVANYDQALVGKNQTRHIINDRIRLERGRHNQFPEAMDRLVCLRNNHGIGLLNGEIYEAAGSQELYVDAITLSLNVGLDDPMDLMVWKAPFIGKEIDGLEDKRRFQEFGYGYALTCHKAQGSSWPRVVVFDQSKVFRDKAAKWLYTAVSRASEELMIIRG